MQNGKEKFVALTGTMGVGKTTATKALAEELGFTPIYEQPSENPYLEKFYKEPQKYAFLSQRHYLTEKIRHTMEVGDEYAGISVALDAYINQDVFSYARAQVVLGNMSEQQWAEYVAIFEAAKNTLPVPDLIIHLKAPVPVLMQRIQGRARGYETGIQQSYVKLLDDLNYKWIEDTAIPVLMVPTEHLNIARSKSDRLQFASLVEEAISDTGTIYSYERV